MILRPSQDSSKRYGHGIKVNKIELLNETEYQETELEEIYPNWSKNILATHTINSIGDLTIIDGLHRTKFFNG